MPKTFTQYCIYRERALITKPEEFIIKIILQYVSFCMQMGTPWAGGQSTAGLRQGQTPIYTHNHTYEQLRAVV